MVDAKAEGQDLTQVAVLHALRLGLGQVGMGGWHARRVSVKGCACGSALPLAVPAKQRLPQKAHTRASASGCTLPTHLKDLSGRRVVAQDLGQRVVLQALLLEEAATGR